MGLTHRSTSAPAAAEARIRTLAPVLALALAVLLLVAPFAARAWAASPETGGTATIGDGEAVSVVLTWGTMDFAYTSASQMWNPQTHAYDRDVEAAWSADGNWIELKNESPSAVRAELSVATKVSTVTGVLRLDGADAAEAGANPLFLELSGTSAVQALAEFIGVGESSAKVWLELSGSIDATYETLGTVTVAITAQ